MNINKVFVAGRLTADPELRTTASGDQVLSFSLATNRFWKDKSGEKKESTEFHNVVAWGRQAEVINQFSKKGSILFVEGRLQTRSWEGKDGQSRKTTEIVAENIQLGPRTGGASFVPNQAQADQPSAKEDVPVIDIDKAGEEVEDEIQPEDLPF